MLPCYDGTPENVRHTKETDKILFELAQWLPSHIFSLTSACLINPVYVLVLYMHTYMCLSICACVWVLEINTECSFQLLSIPFFEISSFNGLGGYCFSQVGWPVCPRHPPVSASQHLGVQVWPTMSWPFIWGLGSRHRSLGLQGKYFINWAILQFWLFSL